MINVNEPASGLIPTNLRNATITSSERRPTTSDINTSMQTTLTSDRVRAVTKLRRDRTKRRTLPHARPGKVQQLIVVNVPENGFPNPVQNSPRKDHHQLAETFSRHHVNKALKLALKPLNRNSVKIN